MAVQRPGESAWVVFTADQPVLDLAVTGDVAVLGFGNGGQLQARSLRNGSVLWNVHTTSGFRGLAVGRDHVTVVTPADRSVRGFSLISGAATGKRRLAGTPWDVTTAGGDVIVAVVDKAQLIDLDAATLATRQVIPTLPMPTGVRVASGTVWAYSALEHRLIPARGKPRGPWSSGVWTENQRLVLQSNGTSLAVLGRERVSIMQPDGSVRRELLIDTPVGLMQLLHDGSILTTSGSQVSVVRP